MNDLYTITEAAAALGVGRGTIFRMLDSGKLERVKISERVVRIRKSDVNGIINPKKEN